MRKIALLIITFFCGYSSFACVTCNKQIQEGIFNNTFYPNLLVMLSAFIVLTVIIAILTRLSTKRYIARISANPDLKEMASVPLTTAAIVLGIGIGGFADGIVLHQILQWHEMLTNKIPADSVVNKSVNMFWDGIFHTFTLVTTIVGIYLMWKLLQKENINRSGFLILGGMSTGWGLFNLVEGIIDHHILGLHNVRELSQNHDLWNYGFLGLGVLLIVIGWAWIKKGEKLARIA